MVGSLVIKSLKLTSEKRQKTPNVGRNSERDISILAVLT